MERCYDGRRQKGSSASWLWRDKEATATTSSVPPPAESLTVKFRSFATSTVFALVLVVPKLLRLRHNGRYWMAFRLLLAVTGALLVIQPLRLVNPWLPGITGLVMFLIALLVPPATPMTRVNDKVRELGALVVVHGGDFQPQRGSRITVRLFVGVDRICVLDQHLQPVLAIPVAEVLSLAVTESDDCWVLRINASHQSPEFSYRGVFAEHLARVAESTIRSVVAVTLPVLPPPRAAGV